MPQPVEDDPYPVESEVVPRWHGAVRELYEEVDREIDPHQSLCVMRGVCCDFDRSPHVLYASELEVRYHWQARGRDWRDTAGLCPFWVDGRCDARETRPLGCRTYFCDPSWRDRGEDIHARFHKRLQEISRVHAVPYRYTPWVDRLREFGLRASLDRPAGDT